MVRVTKQFVASSRDLGPDTKKGRIGDWQRQGIHVTAAAHWGHFSGISRIVFKFLLNQSRSSDACVMLSHRHQNTGGAMARY